MKWLIFVITAGIVFQTAKGLQQSFICGEKETAVQPIGAGHGELIYLDRHDVSCGDYETLKEFRFVRSGLTDGFYRYVCCRLVILE